MKSNRVQYVLATIVGMGLGLIVIISLSLASGTRLGTVIHWYELWQMKAGDTIVTPPVYYDGELYYTRYGEDMAGKTCSFHAGDTLVVKGKIDTGVVFQIEKLQFQGDASSCKKGSYLTLSHWDVIWLMRHKKHQLEQTERSDQIKQIVESK